MIMDGGGCKIAWVYPPILASCVSRDEAGLNPDIYIYIYIYIGHMKLKL